MTWPVSPHRRTDPAKVFLRAGLLLCGFALTWMCAAFGLFLLSGLQGGCRLPRPSQVAEARVLEITSGISIFQSDHNRCPKSIHELIAGDHVNARSFVDPWGTAIAFRCSDDDVTATSAGPDRTFGTADDVPHP